MLIRDKVTSLFLRVRCEYEIFDDAQKFFFCKRSPRVARYLREPLSLERLCCGLVAIGSGRGSQDAARLSWASVKIGQSMKPI